MGVLETQQPKGRAPMGGYWLACGVSRSSTLRGEQALIFNRKCSKSHQDNQGNETNGSSRPPMCVRMNWVNERKREAGVLGAYPVTAGSGSGCARGVGSSQSYWRQSSVAEVAVSRKRMLRTGLGTFGILFLWSKLL